MSALETALQLIETHDLQRIDFKVSDLFGRWHSFAIPANRLDRALSEKGLCIDGSSIPGFNPVHESDLLLIPDLDSAAVDPVPNTPTLSFLCNAADPITYNPLSRDPRYIASKAEEHLRNSGTADEAHFGPEIQFFIFDNVRYQQETNTAFYFVDSVEGQWNTGRDEEPNQGYKIAHRSAYGAPPPADRTSPIRWSIVEQLRSVGIEVKFERHTPASSGQGEIGIQHATLLKMGDHVQWYKYLVRNAAHAHGTVATFMPKPIHGDNGSGMHTHQSLWRRGTPLFYDSNGYGGLSQLARNYIGGLIHHASALLAFTCPTTNSYRRLAPGDTAPVPLIYSMRNRSTAIRVPVNSTAPAQKRIEFRPPDGTANPYLAFSAMMMAGLDGIQRQLDPGDPLDRDLSQLGSEETTQHPSVPTTLEAAIKALEADYEFLLQGDVFTVDVLEHWIATKHEEIRESRARPTPFEYLRYFDS